MLLSTLPNHFDFLLSRLEREVGLGKDSVITNELIGWGEELAYAAVVSSFALQLGVSSVQTDAMPTAPEVLGAPKKFIFKDTALSTLRSYLRERDHPGSPNISVLSFIRHYHTLAAFQGTVAELGIEDFTCVTLEGFSMPMGVEVRHLARV